MDWVQLALFTAAMYGMFSMLKTDIAANREEAVADRREMLNIIREIQAEIKDFHGRLCAIEEKRKSWE